MPSPTRDNPIRAIRLIRSGADGTNGLCSFGRETIARAATTRKTPIPRLRRSHSGLFALSHGVDSVMEAHLATPMSCLRVRIFPLTKGKTNIRLKPHLCFETPAARASILL